VAVVVLALVVSKKLKSNQQTKQSTCKLDCNPTNQQTSKPANQQPNKPTYQIQTDKQNSMVLHGVACI
jgi:hypothetical protein